MRIHVIVAVMFITSGALHAQTSGDLRFSAGALNETTFKLLGDSIAWPVLLSFASRDEANNAFVIRRADLPKVKQFATLHHTVLSANRDLQSDVHNGAKVFCSAELDQVLSSQRAYDSAVRQGNVDEARSSGQQFVSLVHEVGKLVVERRQEDVDARLAQKSGSVDKRKGLLGAWNIANIGDLFAAADAVRTGQASLAQLVFTDGMDVVVDPNTTVVIRESKMDKLNHTIKRDMALVTGSLLTKLSAKAKEINNLSFQAGTSESHVRSARFWASAAKDAKVRLSNYDGRVDVSASKKEVMIGANQGTVVERGKPPLPPVNLLPSPNLKWSRLDTVIYEDKILLAWESIDKAQSYQIDVSPNEHFASNVRRLSATKTAFQFTNIPLTTLYVRLQAIDKLGLRGIDSPTYKLVRNQDTQPPPIYIDGWDTDRKYTILDILTIKGKTEPDARLLQNGKRVALDTDGGFTIRASVEPPEKQIHLAATDQSGNTTQRTLSIVKMDTARVAKIDWNCRIEGNTLHPSTDLIGASGNAYPRVKVTASIGDQVSSVQTSSSGQWAISVKPIKGTPIRIVFDSIDDKTMIVTRTFEVE